MEGGNGLNSGKSIKRQFETPITPGTGGKALDISSGGGSQFIIEGGLARGPLHNSMIGNGGISASSGSAYDEYRTSQFQPPYTNGYPSHPSQPGGGGSGSHRPSAAKKTILRRKCAWKNYPELEAFLISNREEYLRHSAMNYTVQQKQYNNRLTERLLEVAANHNYVFDENDFNFVAVRDRIRCYYKSYVQSSKKRGIIVGYGAQQQTQPPAKKRKPSPENIKEEKCDVGGGGGAARFKEQVPKDNNNNSNSNSSKEQLETNEQSESDKRMAQPNVNTIPESKVSSDDNGTSPLPSAKSIAV